MINRELSLTICASSESFFDKAHENAQTLLKRMGERSAEAEKTLDTFALAKNEYAQFCIDKMPGSRGKHGSSNSEINHSSVLCCMNDGHKKTNAYREEPITLVKDLLGRQNQHCNEMNNLLYNDMKMLTIEKEHLMQVRTTPKTIDLGNASRVLCRPEYEQYKRSRKDAMRELCLE